MSTNNLKAYSGNNEITGDYTFGDSSYEDGNLSSISKYYHQQTKQVGSNSHLEKIYSIPLESVRAAVLNTESQLVGIYSEIQSVLSRLYINPLIDPDLEQAHYKLWDHVTKITDIPTAKESEAGDDVMYIQPFPYDQKWQEKPLPPPYYIPFAEIIFAEKYDTLASKVLLKEYLEAISHSSFSYIYTFRKIIQILLNEIYKIKISIFSDFGDEYEDESEQQVAVQYDAWTKTSLHYAQRIARTISSNPLEIPSTELDNITKEQATKFQAFFAIKLNATETELNDLLAGLQRELNGSADNFYNRYLSPSLKLKKQIADTLEFDFLSTTFLTQAPSLSRELVIATNVLNGNFTAVFADLMERYNIAINKLDLIMSLAHEKRKYANYITQLSYLGTSKRKTVVEVKKDVYTPVFSSIQIPSNRMDKFTSSHSLLDGLDLDDHPQYLLKAGGKITGDITVENGVRIDGIDVGSHSHNGIDGSRRIKATDIDYSLSSFEEKYTHIPTPEKITIDSFIPAILPGGTPVVDAIINIEVPDEISNGVENIEFELIYKEIE